MSDSSSALHEVLREIGLRQSLYGLRTLTTRGRALESQVNLNQLPLVHDRQLRILRAGNGATEGDVGKFWFVVGYSLVGGPDIVPEE